jgi:hypothetical protein
MPRRQVSSLATEIGRDHRLAVARPGGVEDAVDEGDAKQRPHRAAVGLGGAMIRDMSR